MGSREAWSACCLKLPNLEKTAVRAEKISGYLLSSTHPAGRHKARFFARFGFSKADVDTLRASLLDHARLHEVASVTESGFGKRYAVDGALSSPDSRNPEVRVIWFIETGSDAPHFVTAYPLPKAKA